MKLFGHPVHPLLIHFPTALLPMDLALSLLSYTKNEVAFSLAGFYCLVGGVVMGIAAVLTGLLDLLQIPKANKEAMALAIYHGFLNGLLLSIFGIIAYKSWQAYPQLEVPTKAMLITKTILVFSLFAGNYMGGKLIYKHRIGIS